MWARWVSILKYGMTPDSRSVVTVFSIFTALSFPWQLELIAVLRILGRGAIMEFSFFHQCVVLSKMGDVRTIHFFRGVVNTFSVIHALEILFKTGNITLSLCRRDRKLWLYWTYFCLVLVPKCGSWWWLNLSFGIICHVILCVYY